MLPGQTAAHRHHQSPQTGRPVPPSLLLTSRHGLAVLSYESGGHPDQGARADLVEDVDLPQVELQAGGDILSELHLPGLGRGGEGEGEAGRTGGVTEQSGSVGTVGQQGVVTAGLGGAGEVSQH